MTAPPFAYYGGKQRLAARIIDLMPPHRHYVEPFAGSLSVLLAKPRVALETVNDLDGELMNFWRVLREHPAELELACRLTPHSRAEHEAARDLDVADPIERARRVWVRLSQGRAGRRDNTGWRHLQRPGGTNYSIPDYLAAYCSRIAPGSERLAGVSLESRDALDVIRDYGRHREVLLYVDPPYFGDRAAGYAVEMQGREQHETLLAELVACEASVLLSGYANDLYDEALTGWGRTEIDTYTGQGGKRDRRVEVVWQNRTAALTLWDDGEATA